MKAALTIMTLHWPDITFDGDLAQHTFCAQTRSWLLAEQMQRTSSDCFRVAGASPKGVAVSSNATTGFFFVAHCGAIFAEHLNTD